MQPKLVPGTRARGTRARGTRARGTRAQVCGENL